MFNLLSKSQNSNPRLFRKNCRNVGCPNIQPNFADQLKSRSIVVSFESLYVLDINSALVDSSILEKHLEVVFIDSLLVAMKHTIEAIHCQLSNFGDSQASLPIANIGATMSILILPL